MPVKKWPREIQRNPASSTTTGELVNRTIHLHEQTIHFQVDPTQKVDIVVELPLPRSFEIDPTKQLKVDIIVDLKR